MNKLAIVCFLAVVALSAAASDDLETLNQAATSLDVETSSGCDATLSGGDGFIQIGNWRFGRVDNNHFSFSSNNGHTAVILRSDGTVHGGNGNRKDWGLSHLPITWTYSASNPMALNSLPNVQFGSSWVQFGPNCRFGTPDNGHLSVSFQTPCCGQSGIHTADIWRNDGTIHPGPRTCCGLGQLNTFQGQLAGNNVWFGDRFLQIGEFRIADIDGGHASIAYVTSGKTAEIFRSDSTQHPGPRTDYNANNRQKCPLLVYQHAAEAKANAAKAALAAHSGDHKAVFATLMQHVKSGLETMKSDADSQLKAVTDKRDAAKVVLDEAIRSFTERERTFSDAASSWQAHVQACKTAQDAAIGTLAVFNAASSTFNARNPVVDKELAVIVKLVDQVKDLKSINLQETRDMISNLQTFEAEAEPLMNMIDIAREHAEFTKPILDLLEQLRAKLQAEKNSITEAVASAKRANDKAQATSTDTCGKVDAKRIERDNAQNSLNSATSARNAAQKEHDDLQKLWTTTRASSEKSAESYTTEMRDIDRLQACTLAPPKPFKSCFEILSDNPKAQSGVYTIEITQNQKQQVYCDMASNGGGWTLLSSHDANGGYFSQQTNAPNSALSTGTISTAGPSSLYSILGSVDAFKRNGKFEFRYNTLAAKGQVVNTWVTASQTSSPLDSSRAGGCAADWKIDSSNYDVGAPQKLFCGWTPGPSGWAAINGYGPNWTHAVGQFKVYSDWPLVCTYNTHYFCSKIQFWVR